MLLHSGELLDEEEPQDYDPNLEEQLGDQCQEPIGVDCAGDENADDGDEPPMHENSDGETLDDEDAEKAATDFAQSELLATLFGIQRWLQPIVESANALATTFPEHVRLAVFLEDAKALDSRIEELKETNMPVAALDDLQRYLKIKIKNLEEEWAKVRGDTEINSRKRTADVGDSNDSEAEEASAKNAKKE